MWYQLYIEHFQLSPHLIKLCHLFKKNDGEQLTTQYALSTPRQEIKRGVPADVYLEI